MATPYKIQIPLYEGPLDLLLDLIKQQKMSIHDIQISKITSQYLDYLHKLEELNVDVSAEFIYMAASLIYIKSKMLLPPDPLASAEREPDSIFRGLPFAPRDDCCIARRARNGEAASSRSCTGKTVR